MNECYKCYVINPQLLTLQENWGDINIMAESTMNICGDFLCNVKFINIIVNNDKVSF